MTIVQGYQTVDTNIPTTTETICATVAGISTPGRDTRIDLRGLANLTAGAGTTAWTLRIRRGATIADPVVGDPITFAGSSPGEMEIEVADTPGDVAGQTYVLTAQQTGATGNGTITSASLVAELPTG